MLFCSRLVSALVSLGLFAGGQAGPVPASAVVTTSKGQVQGYSGSLGNRYTIPYGKSPTGSLRFRRPEAIDSFESTYDASKLPKACLQQQSVHTPADQSEDCLFMNIFTPRNAEADANLPVFVWVHGGSFLAGSTQELDGFAFANAENMIVVTVQYRLGYFGWLKYDPWGLEGNMGLRDLVLALETVQKEIEAFGGDAAHVTLAGQSSGAQMVKALLSSPSASSLFNRAVMHSAPLDYSPQVPALANAVGSAFLFDIAGCGKQNKGCLWRRTDPSDFFDAQSSLVLAALGGAFGDAVPFAEPFNIVADGELLSGDGQEILDSAKEIIFTTVRDEGCPAVAGALMMPETASLPTESLIQAFFGGRASAITASGLYTAQTADSEGSENNLIQLATDFYWVCPTQQFAVAAAAKSTVYLGEFDLGIQSIASSAFPICDNKVGHEDDISLIFNRSSATLTSNQQALVSEVQARWGSFARSGNPNAAGYENWPALGSSGGLEVLQLGANSKDGSSIATSQRTEACQLYASI